jgi:predicted RNase H-like HicB family nuclease
MKGKKLRATLAYPALFEPESEGGFTVTFPEAGIAATYGPNWDAARAQAEDMLEEAVLGMIAHGEDVPWPASVRRDVACAPQFLCPHRLPPNSKSTGQCAPRGSGQTSLRNVWVGNPPRLLACSGDAPPGLITSKRRCEPLGAGLSSPPKRLRGAQASASSNAFASFRSGVSKPSVNQP